MSELAFYVTGFIGILTIFVGTVVGWRADAAARGMSAGVILALIGFAVLVFIEEFVFSYGSWYEMVFTGALLAFSGGWLLFGLFFVWGQLLRRREKAHLEMEREMMRSLAERRESRIPPADPGIGSST